MNSLYKFFIITGLLVFPAVLSAQHGKLKEYLDIPDNLLQITNPAAPGIISHSFPFEERTVDTEALFLRFVTLPPSETYEDMNYYYDNYVMHIGEEGRQRELEKMKAAARQYKSRRLEEEVLYLKVFLIYDEDWKNEIEHRWKIAQQFDKEGRHVLAVRLKYDLFQKARVSDIDLYYQAFLMGEELLEDLEKVTEEEFPKKRQAYGEIGHLYYHFRDYDNAVPLLERALTDKSPYYFDTANLRARNTLAVYYHTIGDVEKAAYYFRSMLESPDDNYYRSMFQAIALTGLGRIAAQQGNDKEALRLMRTALPIPAYVNDENYAVGIMASMGKSYLKLGQTDKAADMIDSMRFYIHHPNPHVWVSPHRDRDLYSLLSKYYMYTGDIARSEMYADSLNVAEKEYEKVFSDQVILKARQEIYEVQKKIRDDKIQASRNYIIGLVVILILIVAIAAIMTVNSRRLRMKNRSLFERMKDYDMQAKEITRLRTLVQERLAGEKNGSDKEKNGSDKEKNGEGLYLRLLELMEDPKVYADVNLTRKSLADRLFTNESYLRETIMQRTGLTLTEYITGVRLNHARRLLLDGTHKYTVQEIVHECGFGGTSTFYRLFKKYYGMTPDQLRNSADDK